MSCPRCGDPHGTPEDCAGCRVPAARDPGPDAVLGRFHPVVAERLERLLSQRGVRLGRQERDHDVELRVDPGQRDALRAELAMNWAQIVHGLPEERAMEVLASGGANPGWFDAPAGGWVDRSGRLVVEPADDDPTASGTPRLAGPALIGAGLLLLLLGWFSGSGDAVLATGAALALLGVLVPR